MSVPYESGIMTPEELAWTEKDATELLRLLSKGELKSYDVTLAFCKRAAIAQQVVRTRGFPHFTAISVQGTDFCSTHSSIA